MADVTISVASTEYVAVPVTAVLNGVNYNPTGDTVSFDFQVSPTPTSPTRNWVAGSWETAGPPYKAMCLVGPSGTITTLTANTYDIWVKITDNPEVPVRKCGTLQVTNP